MAVEAGQRERMASFGEVLSQQVAGLARPTMAAGDRIGLGILITHLATLPEVHGISVYDADDRTFAVAGMVAENADAFPALIVDEGIVLGTVRVVLAEEVFVTSPSRALRATWLIWLLGWPVALAVCYLLVRTRTKTLADPHLGETTTAQSIASDSAKDHAPGDAATASEELHLVLVVGGDAEDPTQREVMAGDAMHLFRFVAESHRCQATLVEHGYQLAFADGAGNDRAFEAVCAGLLIRRVLAALQNEPSRPEGSDPGVARAEVAGAEESQSEFPRGSLRYALHVGTDPVQTCADAWLIATFARDGGFVISGALHDALERIERLDVVPLNSRAATTLANPALARCYLVLDAMGPHRTVLDRYTKPLVESIRGGTESAAEIQ